MYLWFEQLKVLTVYKEHFYCRFALVPFFCEFFLSFPAAALCDTIKDILRSHSIAWLLRRRGALNKNSVHVFPISTKVVVVVYLSSSLISSLFSHVLFFFKIQKIPLKKTTRIILLHDINNVKTFFLPQKTGEIYCDILKGIGGINVYVRMTMDLKLDDAGHRNKRWWM